MTIYLNFINLLSCFLAFLLKVLKATDSIVLNAVDLTIKKATLQFSGDGDTVVESSDIAFCAEQETATLTFPKVLAAGSEALLRMEFVGNLNDKMKGFYRSKYFTPSGEERYGGVTQL